MQNPTSPRDQAVLEQLEALRGEYQKLSERRIQTETMVQNLEEQLAALRAKAEAEYGTSDPVELEAMLEKWRRENERRVAEYQEHIMGIQRELEKVEAETQEERS